MTPEEFTARANAAVAGVEQDATSYEWLSRNVARRGRRRRALLAVAGATAVVATGVAVAVVPGGGDGPGHLATTPTTAAPTQTPSTTPTATPTPTVVPEPSWIGAQERTADVDGDGRTDRLRIVRDGDPAVDFQWGVEIRFASGVTWTYWVPCCANEAQTLGPIVDLDGDGDLEVAASPGSSATHSGWHLLSLHTRGIFRVHGAQLTVGLDGESERSWGCADRGGLVVTSAAFSASGPGTTGTRTYYKLEGPRLVETDTVRDTWEPGKRPAEYDYAFYCSGR